MSTEAPRKRARCTWVNEGFARGQFHPELVGRRGYPKTYEAWKAASDRCREQVKRLNAEPGKMTRTGVPDGWARRKKELGAIREQAAVEAKEIVREMKKQDLLTTDDARAEEALEACVSILRAKDSAGNSVYSANHVVAAAKTVLEFTKTKPVTKVDTKISGAESFLALVLEDMGKK